jgi:hypothetical protein
MRRTILRITLVLVGLTALLLYPLMKLWPSGWAWLPGQHEYEEMLVGIYATLGVFLLIAARKPERHVSLIWFTVWSSLVHAAIMTVQALRDSSEHGHLAGDIPALVIAAVVLAVVAPRRGVPDNSL